MSPIKFNPFLDFGQNCIITNATSQKEAWQKLMNGVQGEPETGRFALAKSITWEKGISSAMDNESIPLSKKKAGESSSFLSSAELDFADPQKLVAILEKVVKDLDSPEFTASIEQATRIFKECEELQEKQKLKENCDKAGDDYEQLLSSAVKTLAEPQPALHLLKQAFVKEAEWVAAKLQLKWFATVEEKRTKDDKLLKVLNVIKGKHLARKLATRHFVYYISQYIARYFTARKAEYGAGVAHIEQSLTEVAKHIESINVDNFFGLDQDSDDKELGTTAMEALYCKCSNAISAMEFDHVLYEATYQEDVELNAGSIMPPMDLDVKNSSYM